MLAYAPRPERRRLHPTTLALIVGAHAVAILAVMSAKMDLATPWDPGKTEVTFVPLPPEPQPDPQPPTSSQPTNRPIDTLPPIVDVAPDPGPLVSHLPPPDPGPVVNPGPGPQPTIDPPIVRTGPRFATPEGDIRPPYPEAKRALDQEAKLRLRLAIDERGRVVAVDPVGKADPTFLAAARRHILKVWRYKPAMEGDRAIAASTVVTLEFKLD